ncbi:MAG TPA: hypothetical protein VGG03_13100, partial [Thermoanaerobaculia bacterium]
MHFLRSGVLVGLLIGGLQTALGGQPKPRPSLQAGSQGSRSSPLPQRKEFFHFKGRGPDQPLTPGAVHVYLFDLEPGDFLDIQVEQKDLDVAASVLGPGQRFLFRVDRLNGAWGSEQIPLLAEGGGTYTVEVKVVGKGRGTYQIRIQPGREATARDRQNYLGALAYWRGEKLAEGKGADRLLAEGKFEEAQRAWTESGYLMGQADASFQLGQLRGKRRAWSESIVP